MEDFNNSRRRLGLGILTILLLFAVIPFNVKREVVAGEGELGIEVHESRQPIQVGPPEKPELFGHRPPVELGTMASIKPAVHETTWTFDLKQALLQCLLLAAITSAALCVLRRWSNYKVRRRH